MQEALNDIVLGIIGSGGDGVMAAGGFLVKSAAKAGKYALMHKSFGAQIRGGESSCLIRIADEKVICQGKHVNVLLVYSLGVFEMFQKEFILNEKSLIIVDSDDPIDISTIPLDKNYQKNIIKVPFVTLAKEAGGPLYKNIVSLGVMCGLFSFPENGIVEGIKSRFAKKGEDVIAANLNAFNLGKKFALEQLNKLDVVLPKLTEANSGKKVMMDGNHAIALGALSAGCRFFAGYPITPSTEVMHYLSKDLPRVKGYMVQCEDEIASVNMLCGASFSGLKALTSTSGPGLSLMSEGIGLATMAELPIVVLDVQRGGPSTGLPTKTEQSDLWAAVYGAHGDAPRCVIAPTDVEDCIWAIHESFYLAEKYQMPVVILSDSFIGQRYEVFEQVNVSKYRKTYRQVTDVETMPEFFRYSNKAENGVSPVAIPCKSKVTYIAESLQHDEKGKPTSEYTNHAKMAEKRDRKFKSVLNDIDKPRIYGDVNAKVGLITWGSSTGAAIDAMSMIGNTKMKVMSVQQIYPLQTKEIEEFVKSVDKLFIAELSGSAQFAKHIKTEVTLPKDTRVLARVGCMLFSPMEIADFVKGNL